MKECILLLTFLNLAACSNLKIEMPMPAAGTNHVEKGQLFYPRKDLKFVFRYMNGKPCPISEYGCISGPTRAGVHTIWMRGNLTDRFMDEVAVHECNHAAYGPKHEGDHDIMMIPDGFEELKIRKKLIVSECLKEYVDSRLREWLND